MNIGVFCVYYHMYRQIAEKALEFNTSINRLIGDNFFVTKGIAIWAVI